MAGLIWYFFTGMVLYISKSYFEGFLKEAGKDQYQILKNALANMTNKVMSTPRIEPVLFGSSGKVNEHDPYSMALSIYAEANDGNKFKLLLPKPNLEHDYTNIIFKFLEFLNDFHSGVKIFKDIGFAEGSRDMLILVHFNKISEQIEWLNSKPQA